MTLRRIPIPTETLSEWRTLANEEAPAPWDEVVPRLLDEVERLRAENEHLLARSGGFIL